MPLKTRVLVANFCAVVMLGFCAPRVAQASPESSAAQGDPQTVRYICVASAGSVNDTGSIVCNTPVSIQPETQRVTCIYAANCVPMTPTIALVARRAAEIKKRQLTDEEIGDLVAKNPALQEEVHVMTVQCLAEKNTAANQSPCPGATECVNRRNNYGGGTRFNIFPLQMGQANTFQLDQKGTDLPTNVPRNNSTGTTK